MGRKLLEEPLTQIESSQVLTVSKIRANANKRDPNRTTEESAAETSSNTVQMRPSQLCFCVFDGAPDEASPWAKFIDPEQYDDEDKM